ncbi:hypothetical protein JCM19992_03210 [Thermostilla marina]
MRHTSILVLVFGTSVLVFSAPAQAALTWYGDPYSAVHNGGFEYQISPPSTIIPPGGTEEEYRNWAGGVFDADWSANTIPDGTLSRETSHSRPDAWGGTVNPAEGSYLMAIQSPNPLSTTTPDAKYSLLYQKIHLTAGTTISGKIAFDGIWAYSWSLPNLDDDTAFVRIATDNSLTNLVYEYTLSRYDFMTDPGTSSAAIDSSSDFGWRDWSTIIPTTGDYWFAIGIEDGDPNPNYSEYNSYALFDAISTSPGAVVPEPTTWAGLLSLLGTGGLGLFFYRRRKNG